MKKENAEFQQLLFWAVITGNILFMLWITFNGFKERFQGTLPEKLSYVGLMGLLATNSFLLFRKKNRK